MGAWLKLTKFETIWWLSNINKYLVLVSVSITIRWFYWTKHTIEFSSNTPIQHLNLLFREVLPLNGHSCYFHCYRVPAATQSTIPAFRLPCKSVFRDSHHNVSSLNSSTITNRQPEILLSKKPKHYTIERQSNRFWLGETPKKFFVFSSSPRRLIQLYRPLNAPATRNRVKWTTSGVLKGSQTPSQTSNSLVSAFYGC